MKKPFRNPVVHNTGQTNFPSPYELTDLALKNFNIARDKFGSTEILLPDGKNYVVKDYVYPLDDGSIGMYFIPVSDYGSILTPENQLVNGNTLIDKFLRDKMSLKNDEPIYALLNYFHPEQNKGSIEFLTSKSDKIEMGFTHLGAYHGLGYTTNSPYLYHANRFSVDGSTDGTAFGYPANVQTIALSGVPQGILNKNLHYVDAVLNFGIMFPKNYKESKFRASDLNTSFLFYHDWIKYEGYLRNDDSWFTYCAAHKTLVANIALNLPHNLPSFQEVYGQEVGSDLFQRFIKLYSNIIGPDPGFVPIDDTDFIPLWKQQGLTIEQISPFTLQEFNDYQSARHDNRLGTFTGKKPLLPHQGTVWTAQTSADIIYNFIRQYVEILDAGAVSSSAVILGFMPIIDERMGISPLEYLTHAMPVIETMMVADARTFASKDPKNYLKTTFFNLIIAYGGTQNEAFVLEDEMAKIKVVKLTEEGVDNFIKNNYVPEALAAWSLIKVVEQWNSIIQAGSVEPLEAYNTMMENIQRNVEISRDLLVTNPSKIEYNTPPAIIHGICNGIYEANEFVSVQEVCTIVDFSQLQLKKETKLTQTECDIEKTDNQIVHPIQGVELTPEMEKLIEELREIVSNLVVEAAYNDAVANVQPILLDGSVNPWAGTTVDYFVDYFVGWCTFVPSPTGGLGKIVPFTYFYLNNKTAYYFINTLKSRRNSSVPYTKEIFEWNIKFIKLHGKFMDSPASLIGIQTWLNDPSIKLQDFIIPEGGFKSFNEFFTRKLKPSANARPISFPDDDSVVVASADAEINFIETDLTLTTSLQVKTRQINVKDLLNNSEYAPNFVGGTAISCVLMPNNYHRYHSPVTGEIVESEEVAGIYNGIKDGEHWFNQWNVGESSTDFSIFEDFHRAYFIFKTEKYGYVAMIPVGLNTISGIYSSMINHHSSMVPPGCPPVPVKKGDELGHFAYGGSLNILLFQKNVFSSVSVLMGQRLGIMNPI